MPICKKCTNPFSSCAIIDGVKRSFSHRKYCLDCSPFGQHNVRQLEKTSKERVKQECQRCGQPSFKGKHCSACAVTLWRIRLKEKAVAYKGGQCCLCGYSKCIKSLDFHHKDPNEKDFGIGTGFTRSWEKVKAELDKCILVCRNCHGEIHAGVTEIPTGSNQKLVKKIELTPEQTEALAQASLDAQKRADEWREATKMTPELWNFRVTPFKQ